MAESNSESRDSKIEYDIQGPPKTLGGTLVKLGPGMIIAGSIVGSGELINTTKAGAEAGFWLLWLIIIGCVIKVFAQVEIGRYTVAESETALQALDRVPGPRWRVNWIVWFWAAVMCTVITQQGGIVGGVGQALSIWFPLTEQGEQYNDLQDEWVKEQVALGQLYKAHPQLQSTAVDITALLELQIKIGQATAASPAAQSDKERLDKLLAERRAAIGSVANADFEALETSVLALRNDVVGVGEPRDAYYWALILGIVTSIMLYVGRYGFIQAFSTIFVGAFTVMTIATLVMLQMRPNWAVSGSEVMQGLSFRLPPVNPGSDAMPLLTALAAFGIIGVGAIELITYPYWCLEKGYAKYAGPRDDSPDWSSRARGWMRVMRIDAWSSMVVYTFATVAFYLLGAAVLWRTGLNPGGQDLIRTLAEMYVPVFGTWAPPLFLFGAFAVLYSTYFVAAAGNARTVADAMGLVGLTESGEGSRRRWTRIVSAIWPLIAVAMFWIVGFLMGGQRPAVMVISAGIGQGLLLPMLGLAALWFRYRRCANALRPGILWDVMLWLSFVGFILSAGWTLYETISKFLT